MFIGIDLGTSSLKTVLINDSQKIIGHSSQPLKISNPYDGYYEQDPKSWFDATTRCFDDLKNNYSKEFRSVKAIGISGQMHGATLVDKKGNILRPCILWNDTRSFKECALMEKNYPLLRKETGNLAMPGFTAPKLLWIKENEKEIYKNIYKILLPKDYLRFRLTNSYHTDMSDASGTLWLNVKDRKWSDNLLELTGLNASFMPTLVEGSEPTEYLSNDIKNKFGFLNRIIVAGGAGDQAAGAIGSGVIENKQSMISLGTSGVYFSPTKEFFPNTNDAVHSFCHCIPDTWHHMSVMLSATNCLNWISNLNNIKISDSILKAKYFFENDFKINSTPYFLPYLSGERTPHNNPYLRGSFHMINTSTSFESMIYSVIEGISFGIKDGFEAVHSVSQKSEDIYFIGGGSKSDFWGDFISSTLNQEIIVGEDSEFGPALGVARLSMIATNEYKNSEIISNMKLIRKNKPSEDTSQILNERYNKWKLIVDANKHISKNIMENTSA